MDSEGYGMTDEHNFGAFTREEVNEAVREALKTEQNRSARLIMLWSAAAYFLGVAVGMIV